MVERIEDVETLIIGAGLIGSSVAMHLSRLGMSGIRVVDFDLEGTLSSSELNAGGVRATWLQPINIQTSQISIDYFATVADEVGYKACGYLWMHSPESLPRALEARELQIQMGWPVEAWDVSELKRRVPFIDKTDGVAGALFSPRDGLINSNLLKNHFRSKAREGGVVFDDRIWIRNAEFTPQGKFPVEVTGERFEKNPTHDEKISIYSGKTGQELGIPVSHVKYRSKRVINCAGPWAAEIAKILQYPSPVYAIRRQICIFDCRDVDLTPYGMFVDTSGVYFHHEATNGLAGFASPQEPRGVNYHYDGEDFFMEVIWPALYERSSGFERLKHLNGWSGLYEISPDESAVIGLVELGEAGKHGCVYEAHAFSGHGAMHSYGAGLALAEKIVRGQYETLDVSMLNGKRFASGQWVQEGLII